jgi:hypothetical protein
MIENHAAALVKSGNAKAHSFGQTLREGKSFKL